jgi:hypothetical protein
MRKLCKQIESRINIGSKIYRMNQIFALVTSTPKRSSHAIDKDIEVKKVVI